MRIYPLTPETRMTITTASDDLAKHAQCTRDYLGKIVRETETDPFSRFLRFFRAAAKAGVHKYWLRKLLAVAASCEPPHKIMPMPECMLELTSSHAELMNALYQLETDRPHDVLEKIERVKEVLKDVEVHVLGKLEDGE